MNQYEQDRENRIAENKARLAAIGLLTTIEEIESTIAKSTTTKARKPKPITASRIDPRRSDRNKSPQPPSIPGRSTKQKDMSNHSEEAPTPTQEWLMKHIGTTIVKIQVNVVKLASFFDDVGLPVATDETQFAALMRNDKFTAALRRENDVSKIMNIGQYYTVMEALMEIANPGSTTAPGATAPTAATAQTTANAIASTSQVQGE